MYLYSSGKLISANELFNKETVNEIKTTSIADRKIYIKDKVYIRTMKNFKDIFYDDINVIKSYPLSEDIKFALEDIKSYINNNNDSKFILFYLKPLNIPLFIKGETYIKDNKKFIINNLDDAKKYLFNNKNIKIPSINNEEITTIENNEHLKLHEKVIDRPDESIILEIMSEYLTSEYMSTDHPESDIVINDKLNISDKYILSNTSAIIYERVTSFIGTRLAIIDEILINMLTNLYKIIFDYFLSIIDIYSKNSLEIKLNRDNIKIIETSPPSSKRYLLNTYIKGKG